MKIIAGQDEIIRAWMAQKLGYPLSEGIAFGVWSDTERRLIGGAVFNNYTGPGIEMTIVGRGFFSRTFWRFLGDFVYRQMGCVRLVVTTRRLSKRRGNPVGKIAKRAGFKFEGIARRFYGDHDGIQWSLLKEEAIALGYFTEEPVRSIAA